VQPTRLIILLLAFSAFVAELTDPSSRAGRLNYIDGPVSSQPAFMTDWVKASFNPPLTSDNAIWGGALGPREIRVGWVASRSNAACQFLHVDDRALQIQRLLGYDYDPRPKSRGASLAAGARSATPTVSMRTAGSSAAAAALARPQTGLTQSARNEWKK